MADITILFKESMEWVNSNYTQFGFVMERDFVWTIQKHLSKAVKDNGLPFVVFNDYPIEKGTNRSKSVDLAVVSKGVNHIDILNGNACAEFISEFKFEPSAKRTDIFRHKLPVVFWSAVIEDINRIKRFTQNNVTKTGVAVFVDEFGRYKKSSSPIDYYSKWGSYKTNIFNISVLWTSFMN